MTTTNEITCREVVEVVTDYLEERLTPSDRERFEDHLERCPYCRTYLEQMRITIRTLGRLPEESIPPDVREQLLLAFRDWRD